MKLFLGIKNDMSRTGFQVLVPGSSDKKLDPVGTLKVYIERTESVRPKSTVPVFIALLPPTEFCHLRQ